MFRRLVAAAIASALAACGGIEHDSPFDPATPPAQQARATLAGDVSLEASGVTPPSLAGVHVSVPGTSLSADTDATGHFAISAVPVGTYSVQALASGYDAAVVTGIAVTLDDGNRTVTVPTLALKLSRGSVAGFVSANALGGAGSGPLSGATVSVNGLQGGVVTDDAGGFLIAGVPSGSWTLTVSRVGFLDGTINAVQVAGNGVVDVGTLGVDWDPGGVDGTLLVQGAADSGGVTVRVKGATLIGTPFQATTTSAPDGSYGLQGLVPAGSYNVTFELANYAVVGTATTVAPHTTTTLAPVTLVRDTGGVIGVATLQGQGDSSGIQVALTPPPTPSNPAPTPAAAAITDASGSWHVDALPVGTYTIGYAKTGYQPQSASVTVVSHAVVSATPVTLAAIPGILRGTCLLEGAAALAGSTVRIAGSTLSTVTLADGSWVLNGVGAGAHVVVFERSGFDSQQVQVVTAPGDDLTLLPVTLAISRGGVSGVFTLQGMASSAGVVVTASGPGNGSTVTDASGAFALSGLPVGTYSVTARRDPDWQATTVTGIVVPASGVAAVPGSPLALVPLATASLSGTVALEEGGDPSGATISVSGVDFRGGSVSRTATAAAVTGAWSVSALLAGTYQVSASKAGHETPPAVGVSLSTGQSVPLGPVTLPLSRGSINGQFTLAGAASSAGVTVTATGPSTATAVTDATGAFSLPGLPIGTYSVTARRDPDWQPQTVSGVAVAANATAALPGSPVSLSPVATASISGTVLLEATADASGTTVNLGGTDFRGVAVSALTTTSAAGAFSFGALRAGSYQVTFAHAAFDAPPPVGLSVVTGQAASIGALTLAASRGSVTGTVLATGAPSQAGTVVTVSGGPDTASVVTDATGAFRIDRLRVGSGYQATFTRPDYATGSSATFSIAANALTTLAPASSISLSTAGSIAGAAGVERGTPSGIGVALSGVDVNGAPVSRSTTTDALGAWSFTGLPNGTYAVTLTKSSYEPRSLTGLVVAGGAVSAPAVTLLVATGTIGGQVALSAGSVPGFAVGSDFSGVVVTLAGTDVPVPAAVTDAAGNYRFTGVPVSLAGAAFTVTAKRPSYQPASTSVTAAADTTVTVGTVLTLPVNAGSLSGTALLWDNVGNAGQNATSAGVTIQVSGSAFNGTSYAASPSPTSDAAGAWTVPALPPGTYDVVATDTNRTCAAYPTTVVAEGAAVAIAGPVKCVDAVVPGAVVLGTPTPPAGALPGYTNVAVATVPIAAPATDGTLPASNFRGYQTVVGASADWSAASIVAGQPGSLTFSLPTGGGGAPVDGAYTLWARAIDWSDNTGPATSATVIVDSAAPPVPAVSTSQARVNATSAAVTLSGSDGSPNFLHYEACTGVSAAPGIACSASPTCVSPLTPTATPASFSAQLTADARNCVWARARDKAGNASAFALAEIVSDLTPPAGPTISPLFDPTSLTIHADYADFFITGAATDGPVGGGAWAGIASVEVNTGAGFSALCPAPACHAGNVYNPCACSCTDPRLVCRDGAFYAIRVPLLGGTANDVAVRAVDVAGNVGSGAAQSVPVAGQSFQVSATSFDEGQPRVRGRILVFKGVPTGAGASSVRLVDLGANQLFDVGDTSCEISGISATNALMSVDPVAEPLSATAVVYGDAPTVSNAVKIRRAGLDGKFCTGDDTTTIVKGPIAGYPWFSMVSASFDATGVRERAAWVERQNGTGGSVVVRDGGADKVLGTVDDTETVVFTVVSGYPKQVQIAGDTLVFGIEPSNQFRSAAGSLRVVNAVGGSFAPGTATTFNLPVTTILAALDDGGAALAYFGIESGVPTLHVRYPGPDGAYGTGDDVDVTRTFSGTSMTDGGLAIRGGHVVLTEGSGTGGAYIDHWFAGADGVFGTSDDTFARVLPNAPGRFWPALGTGISGGIVYVQSGPAGGNGTNGDVLGVDLSSLRWDVAGAAAPMAGPITNKAGTLFYRDSGGTVRARTSDGRETTLLGVFPTGLAADDGNLFLTIGSAIWWYQRDPVTGQFFTGGAPAPRLIASATGGAGLEAVGGGRAVFHDTGNGHTSIIEPSPTLATPVVVSLEGVPAGYKSWFGGAGASAGHVVFGCQNTGTFAQQVCALEPVDGIYGNGNDRAFVLTRPSGPAYANPIAIAASGNRVAVVADGAGGPHLYVLDTGPDGKLSFGGDDVEVDYGPIVDGRLGGMDIAGSMVAWSTDAGAGSGQQIFLADFVQRTQQVLTSHYSGKPTVAVDPSGRTYWLDQVFPTSAIFVNAP